MHMWALVEGTHEFQRTLGFVVEFPKRITLEPTINSFEYECKPLAEFSLEQHHKKISYGGKIER